MRVNIFSITEINSGRIGTMPRPRGGDWLDDEIKSLREAGVDVIVSLLEMNEEKELEIDKEAEYCQQHGIAFIQFPIADYGVPSSMKETGELARRLLNLLAEGKGIVIHCRQGIGRSSLIAACVLVMNGVSVTEAFELIQSARGCKVPDTQEQCDWVFRFREYLVGRDH